MDRTTDIRQPKTSRDKSHSTRPIGISTHWWGALTPSLFESMLHDLPVDLRGSWQFVRRLRSEEAKEAVDRFVRWCVLPRHALAFRVAYARQGRISATWLRSRRAIDTQEDVRQTAGMPNKGAVFIDVHWPIPGRVVAYRIRGETGEVGRLFPIWGPAIAVWAGRKRVGWLNSSTNQVTIAGVDLK